MVNYKKLQILTLYKKTLITGNYFMKISQKKEEYRNPFLLKMLTPLTRTLSILLFLFCVTASAADQQVEIKTSLGTIVLELRPDKAPRTVENFLHYVEKGHYKSTIFHRVIPKFMIQGGGFDKMFSERPTKPPIENEAANGLKNEIGTIAMARTNDPHSASGQFFINIANNTFLNYTAPTTQGYGYTVVGKVIKGMEIVNKIATVPTGASGPFSSDAPKEMVIIEEIKSL